MKQTKVILTFPRSGKKYFKEHCDEKTSVLIINPTDFRFKKRKRTKGELELEKEKWDADLHLLSGEGYINRIKNDLITVLDETFPHNMTAAIKENIGEVDYILLNYCDEARLLVENGIKPILVFPEESMKEEWVGREILSEKYKDSKAFIQYFNVVFNKRWNECLPNMREFAETKKLKHYELQSGEYLSDAITELKKRKKKDVESAEEDMKYFRYYFTHRDAACVGIVKSSSEEAARKIVEKHMDVAEFKLEEVSLSDDGFLEVHYG